MYDICEGYDFGDLYGECYHGAMHAAFLWAVADAGEDVLGSVPVDGAFTGARLCGNQIAGAPRHRRDVVPVTAEAMAWRFTKVSAIT